MTGYVKPDIDELKVKDLKLYNAYYCGICTALSKKYGPLSRIFLSYDATFMAILSDAFSNGERKFGESRCPLPPFRKKRVVRRNHSIDFGVEISHLSTRLKIDDTRRDSKFLRRMFAILAIPIFGKVDISFIKVVKPLINKMIFLELTESANPDEVSDAFGEVMVALIRNVQSLQRAKFFLYLIGKWVYLIDALDDISKDITRGVYNPYFFKYKEFFSGSNPEDFTKFVKKHEEFSLKFLIHRIQEEFTNIEKDMKRNSQLVKNVVFYGIPKTTSKILEHS